MTMIQPDVEKLNQRKKFNDYDSIWGRKIWKRVIM